MELFLNLLWMLIAVGLLGAWRTRWVHQQHRAPRHSLQEWSALSIALVLLFFAVSMTDEMHEISTRRSSGSNAAPIPCPDRPSSKSARFMRWKILIDQSRTKAG